MSSQAVTTPSAAQRDIPHPHDLSARQLQGVACVWCRRRLFKCTPVGTTSVKHPGNGPLLTYRVFACEQCVPDHPEPTSPPAETAP